MQLILTHRVSANIVISQHTCPCPCPGHVSLVIIMCGWCLFVRVGDDSVWEFMNHFPIYCPTLTFVLCVVLRVWLRNFSAYYAGVACARGCGSS